MCGTIPCQVTKKNQTKQIIQLAYRQVTSNYISFTLSYFGYTAQFGLQCFADRRACRCIRFRFLASRFPYFVHPCLRVFYETRTIPSIPPMQDIREAVQTVYRSCWWCDIMAWHILQVVTEYVERCGGCRTSPGFLTDVGWFVMTVQRTCHFSTIYFATRQWPFSS